MLIIHFDSAYHMMLILDYIADLNGIIDQPCETILIEPLRQRADDNRIRLLVRQLSATATGTLTLSTVQSKATHVAYMDLHIDASIRSCSEHRSYSGFERVISMTYRPAD